MADHSASPILPWLGLVGSYLIMVWPVFCLWWAFLPKRQAHPGQECAGLTAAPACPACEAEAAAQGQASAAPEPPPRLEQKRGCPRTVDTSNQYCPNRACCYYGWAGYGNIRSNGHPSGGCWRQLECTVCKQYFMETTGTIFYRKQGPPETIWRALKALAEGLSIRATARVFEVDPNTVEAWLRQAAEHMEAVSRYLIHDLSLTQVQVDELWALLGKREVAEESQEKRKGKRWVWAGMDPVSKLWLATVVGDRSQACAQLLIHAIVLLLAPGCLPLFLSDQWSAYALALLSHFGHWVAVPRRHPRGRPPKPRWQPLPGLQYAQLVKERVKGRVVSVTHRVIYGSLDVIEAILEHDAVGKVINTAFIERLNLSIRQHAAALTRKVISLAKSAPGLQNQLSLGRAYYNFCLPHASLRLPLPEPLPTKGTGSPKKWQPRSPAMAADVTDRLWRLEELLLFRVPPWQQTAEALP